MQIEYSDLYDDDLYGGEKKLGGLIRLLMYLLRHDTSGALTKDKDGYVKVDDLVKHPSIKEPDTVLDDIKKVIEQNNEKGVKMFELKGTGSSMKIKAFPKDETPAPSRRRSRKKSRKGSRKGTSKGPRKKSRRRSRKLSRKKSRKKTSKKSRKKLSKSSRRRSRKSSKKKSQKMLRSKYVTRISDLAMDMGGGRRRKSAKCTSKRISRKRKSSKRKSRKRKSSKRLGRVKLSSKKSSRKRRSKSRKSKVSREKKQDIKIDLELLGGYKSKRT